MAKNFYRSFFLSMVVFGLVFCLLPIPVAHAEQSVDLSTPPQTYKKYRAAIDQQIDQLFDQLASSLDEENARAIEKEIWQSWMALPDAMVRKLVKEAMEARRWYDFAKALKLLNKVVKLAPDYAEGWNQRAFILYLQEKFDQSLSDLEKALELEPRHFGAMAGQARILMRQGRFATGQALLKKAVKIHPYLRERSMIVKTNEKDL